MKTLAYYMSLPYPIEIIPDEGGFVALIPDLPGCMSSGETAEDSIRGIQEAKELWIEGRLEDNAAIPEPTATEDYSGKFVLRIPKSLHRSLDYEARKQGTSLNQYVVHLLSERNAVLCLQESLNSTVRSWVEGYFVRNERRTAEEMAWKWAEQGLCFFSPAHRPWDTVPSRSKVTYVGVGTDRSDIVSMIPLIPQVPEKLTTSHDPKSKKDYVETAWHHDV